MADLTADIAVARETAAGLREAARTRRISASQMKDNPAHRKNLATLRDRAAKDERRARAIEALIAAAEAAQ